MPPPGHQAPHPLQDPLYASPRPPYPQSATTMLLLVDVGLLLLENLATHLCFLSGQTVGCATPSTRRAGRSSSTCACRARSRFRSGAHPHPPPPSWRVLPIARPSRERCGVRRGPSTGNLWRTTGDICGPGHGTWGGVIRNFYGDTLYPNSTMPGAWQDPDMLGAPALLGPFALCCRLSSAVTSTVAAGGVPLVGVRAAQYCCAVPSHRCRAV